MFMTLAQCGSPVFGLFMTVAIFAAIIAIMAVVGNAFLSKDEQEEKSRKKPVDLRHLSRSGLDDGDDGDDGDD